MKQITSKTHRFISVRTVPSDYYLNKFHNGCPKANKLMHDVYKEYFNFYKEFIKFAIDKGYDEYFEMEYMLGAMECSKEELHELTGIKICSSNNHYIFCIPKTSDNDRIYNYMIENLPCKFKVLQKTYGTYTDFGIQTWARKMYKRNYNDFISKHSKN